MITRRNVLLTGAAAAGALAAPAITWAQSKETISFAYQFDPMFQASMWALRNGRVTSDLIDVELSVLPIPGLIQATTTKQYDVIQGDTLAVARAMVTGLDLVIMSTAIRFNPAGQGHNIWARADAPWQSIAEMQGKRIAVSSLGAAGTNMMRYLLAEKYGVNISITDGDFQFVQTPPAAMIAGLLAEHFEAAQLIQSQTFQARTETGLRVLERPARDMYEMWGLQMTPSVNLGYPEKIAERPEAYAEFGRVLRESVLYLHANMDEVFAAVAAEEGITNPDLLPTTFNEFSEFPGNLTENDSEAIRKLWDLALQYGDIQQVPDLESVLWADAVRN